MLTVGEILKDGREKKGLSLSQIEKEIKIREKFLASIENNDWRWFSSKIYIVGIIKNYAKYLSIPPEKAIAYFYRDYERNEEVKFKKKVSLRYLTPETKKAFLVFLTCIFLAFFSYFGVQLKNYFSPPKVIISSPKTAIFRKGDSITIVGQTEKDAVIMVGGERIFQDRSGRFEFKHPLVPGKNLVVIEVTGANGKKAIVEKEYFKQGETKQ